MRKTIIATLLAVASVSAQAGDYLEKERMKLATFETELVFNNITRHYVKLDADIPYPSLIELAAETGRKSGIGVTVSLNKDGICYHRGLKVPVVFLKGDKKSESARVYEVKKAVRSKDCEFGKKEDWKTAEYAITVEKKNP